ncbi:hypothetical protein NDU88_004957 [Pleurodeles waltl]|uniref:Uncharacterized protein n=1 Tax=Pleurodeles waltl TaxID=8319 RepID=A0AAV7RMX6_PLEWA|nr:hypothetical protein NDU88_004957 [Pleurodeles waltl]
MLNRTECFVQLLKLNPFDFVPRIRRDGPARPSYCCYVRGSCSRREGPTRYGYSCYVRDVCFLKDALLSVARAAHEHSRAVTIYGRRAKILDRYKRKVPWMTEVSRIVLSGLPRPVLHRMKFACVCSLFIIPFSSPNVRMTSGSQRLRRLNERQVYSDIGCITSPTPTTSLSLHAFSLSLSLNGRLTNASHIPLTNIPHSPYSYARAGSHILMLVPEQPT